MRTLFQGICTLLLSAGRGSLWLAIVCCVCSAHRPAQAAPGGPDSTFSQRGSINGPIYAVAVDALTNIWIGGRFTQVYGQPYPGLALLHADGTLNTEFNPAVMTLNLGEVHALVVDGFYNVYAGGKNGINRLTYQGPGNGWALDSTFSANASAPIRQVTSLAIETSSGNITALYAAGNTHYTNGIGVVVANLIKYTSYGGIDNGFILPEGLAYQAVLQVRFVTPGIIPSNSVATDHLIIAGVFGFTGTLSTIGTDPVLYFDPSGYASCIAQRPNTLAGCIGGGGHGQIVAGGFFAPAFDYNQGDQGNNLWLNRFGGSDPSYFHNISHTNYPTDDGSYISAIEAFPGGDVLAAGWFTRLGGIYVNNFAHILPNGQVDTAFQNSVNFSPTAMAQQPDGKIIVVGGSLFTPVTGQLSRRLAMDAPRSVTFTAQPAPTNQTVYAGDFVAISATVDAWPAPSLVWVKNGAEQTNFTSSYLSIYPATTAHTGDYKLRARTFCGDLYESQIAHLTVLDAPPAPINDMFSNAIVITGTNATVTGTIRSATREPGEPDPSGIAANTSVWWTWTATSNGVVTLSVLGSDYPASINVFTGNSASSLTFVTNNCHLVCGDGCYCAGLVTNISFAISQGTTYRIAIGGQAPIGGLGNIVLTLNAAYVFVPPNPWLKTTFGSSVLNAAGFGGGSYVVGGDLGRIGVSADGSNWTQVTSHVPSGDSVWGLDYADGKFIAVGDQGTIVTSPDGTTWTAQTSGVASGVSLYSLTHGTNGLVVAVGDTGGTIATSPNGVSWSLQNSGVGPLNSLYSVAYGNGLYAAVGDAGIITSPDGTNWATQSAINNLNSITWGKGRFVAVASNVIKVSNDGTNWTSAASSVPQALYWVTYGGGYFVAVGQSGTIRTSPDGNTWITDNSGTTQTLWGVAYCQNGQFLAVGNAGTILLHKPFQILTPTLAGGLIQFQVTGLNGATAVIESTSSLNPPNWQPVATNLIVNSTVTFSYSVTAAPSKFYRARLQ